MSKKSKTKNYSIFTGCLIPSRFPSIEIASRKVLDILGVKLHELEGTTCCPNQMAIKSTDKNLWELIAARNIAIAEEKGFDIISLCNGCYNTLKTVNTTLKNNDKLRNEVNNELSKQGLEFKGKIKVKHISEVLLNDIGIVAIEKVIVRQLNGLRAATFSGCHITRPEDHMSFDDTEKPKALDKLVKILGIKTMEYPGKYSCCGGGLKIANFADAMTFTRSKFSAMKENYANCMIVVCPYCRAHYEWAITEIKESFNEKIDLPVFYLTELLGLAMGFEPKELGLDLHYKNSHEIQKLLKTILGEGITDDFYDETVTKEQLGTCLECQACFDDCSVILTTDYHPEELIALASEGRFEELIERKDFWYCMNCHECIDRCPQEFGMVKFIFRLKNYAIAHGLCPEIILKRDTELSSSGFSFKPDKQVREKYGLPAIKGASSSDIVKLITGSGVQKIIKECDSK